MMAGQAVFSGRIERGLVVGAWRVEIGTATPVPGESLSAAARRLAERVVADVTGLPAAVVRVASLLPSGRPVVASDDGLAPTVKEAIEREAGGGSFGGGGHSGIFASTQ